MARASKHSDLSAVSLPAQELTDLADSLTAAANGIAERVNTTMDPLSPQGRHILDTSAHIADQARNVRALALATLTVSVKAAVADLTGRIRTATNTLKTIETVAKVLSITAAILSVAAAVATEDPFAAVSSITNLIMVIDGATSV